MYTQTDRICVSVSNSTVHTDRWVLMPVISWGLKIILTTILSAIQRCIQDSFGSEFRIQSRHGILQDSFDFELNALEKA